MKRSTPAKSARKWAQNLAGSIEDIRAGIMAMDTSPGVKAAARKQAYLDGVQRSAQRWADKLNNMSLQTWQQKVIEKGLPVIAERARIAIPKMAAHLTQWRAFMDSIESQLKGMPRGTLEQNIARSNFVIREARKWKERRAAGRIEDMAVIES